MSKNVIETVVGFIVLAVALEFVVIAYKSGSITSDHSSGYEVYADFGRIDGVNIGSVVELSGIKIGIVNKISLDHQTYNAVVGMSIDKQYQLPVDSSAEIIGNGFLGDKYVSIAPGASEKFIENNGRIQFTQSSISLESLIGKFIFGSSNKSTHAHDDLSNHPAA